MEGCYNDVPSWVGNVFSAVVSLPVNGDNSSDNYGGLPKSWSRFGSLCIQCRMIMATQMLTMILRTHHLCNRCSRRAHQHRPVHAQHDCPAQECGSFSRPGYPIGTLGIYRNCIISGGFLFRNISGMICKTIKQVGRLLGGRYERSSATATRNRAESGLP